MKQLTCRHLEILLDLVEFEKDSLDDGDYLTELHDITLILQDFSNQIKSQKDTSNAMLATRIDKAIYSIVKAEFTNTLTNFSGLTVTDMQQAYQRWGQHKLDFTKIYDL